MLNDSQHVDRAISVVLKESLKGGLLLLWRGFDYARDLGAAKWEFAVDKNDLNQAGLSAIDLRWLIARGYIELAPYSSPNDKQTRFADAIQSFHGNQASFVLTNLGLELAYEVLLQTVNARPSIVSEYASDLHVPGCAAAAPSRAQTFPTWDHVCRELRCGESLIKHFRWAAVNQETILMAFEEEGWPTHIDDPLPPKLNQNPKIRLHDTIKCLNRNHENRLIHFSGDGTGEGVLWKFL